MVRRLVGVVAVGWASFVGAVEVFDLATVSLGSVDYGECLLYDTPEEIFPLEIVPCDTPHNAQAYDSIDLSEHNSFPGDDVLMQESISVCLPRFEGFVGSDVQASELRANALLPRWASWNSGDRSILCVAEAGIPMVDFDAQDSGR